MRNSDAEVWFRFGCIQPKKATKREKKRVASSFWNRFGWVRFGRVWWENRGIHIRCSYALVEVDVEKKSHIFRHKIGTNKIGCWWLGVVLLFIYFFSLRWPGENCLSWNYESVVSTLLTLRTDSKLRPSEKRRATRTKNQAEEKRRQQYEKTKCDW